MKAGNLFIGVSQLPLCPLLFYLELVEFTQYLIICFLDWLALLDSDKFVALLIASEVYPIIREDKLLLFALRFLKLSLQRFDICVQLLSLLPGRMGQEVRNVHT